MKIVLVFPPFYLEALYNLPPLGLINLATAIKTTHHQTTLIDFVLAVRQKTLKLGKNIYDDCAEKIMAESPDVVGFSAQCTTYPSIIQISKRIKDKRPGVKIVIGGHNASFVDQATLDRYPFVDAVVRGEGEVTFQELIAAYETGKDERGIPGVTYRYRKDIVRNEDRNLISNLDELPLPDYSFLPPLSEYCDACQLPRSIAILEVGRGCPHRCIYCSESIMWKRQSRTFSVSRLVEEMENLHRNFGAQCFVLTYDQFTANRKFVESFCHRVLEKGLSHLPWYCISRLDSVDTKLLALMKESGCESMCYGIDSGSKKTLSFIRKNIDKEILYQRVRETADHGILPTLSFVIGFPEEEKADIDETLMLALRAGIVGNNNPLIQLPTILPGTDLHKKYSDRLIRGFDTYFARGLEFDEGKRIASDEQMINADPMIFSSFYNVSCPGRSLEDLDLIATYFPLVVQFYPKTFLLLCLECKKSVSDLFIRWFIWLNKKLKRKGLTLSAQECYLYFKDFVSEILGENGKLKRKHFPDILKYENKALDVAKFSCCSSPFHIDLNNIKKLRPVRSQNFIIEEFDFNLPVIILDLKTGDFNKAYTPQKTLLIFKQESDILDVTEINPFTKDFLESCDGKITLETICRKLYGRYGRQMSSEDFFDACVEAVNILGKGGFFESLEST